MVTYDGAVQLNAGGQVNIAPDYGVFTGSAPITVMAGGDILQTRYYSSAPLRVWSLAGSIAVSDPFDAGMGAIFLDAAADVAINAPIVSLRSGEDLSITAGRDIAVNAQIDGIGGVAGGAARLSAGGNVTVNDDIVTQDGDILIAASGSYSQFADSSLVSGQGALSVRAGNGLVTGNLSGGTHKEMGVVCYENPAMGIYFIEDPDGYWLEVLAEQR